MSLVFLRGKRRPFGVMKNRNKPSEKEIRAQRDEKIFRLRNEGWTFQAIADEVGLSNGRVQHIIKRMTE